MYYSGRMEPDKGGEIMGSMARVGLRLSMCALAFMAAFQLTGWLIAAIALAWGALAPAPLSDQANAVLGVFAIFSPLAALLFAALAALWTWVWTARKFSSKASS